MVVAKFFIFVILAHPTTPFPFLRESNEQAGQALGVLQKLLVSKPLVA
jgi:hypothetical protein